MSPHLPSPDCSVAHRSREADVIFPGGKERERVFPERGFRTRTNVGSARQKSKQVDSAARWPGFRINKSKLLNNDEPQSAHL